MRWLEDGGVAVGEEEVIEGLTLDEEELDSFSLVIEFEDEPNRRQAVELWFTLLSELVPVLRAESAAGVCLFLRGSGEWDEPRREGFSAAALRAYAERFDLGSLRVWMRQPAVGETFDQLRGVRAAAADDGDLDAQSSPRGRKSVDDVASDCL